MKTGEKYPLAVVVTYGPDYKTATKLVASIFTRPGQQEPFAIEKWTISEGDIIKDDSIMAALHDFIKRHHAVENVAFNPSWGCPHEEGIDYPDGGECPRCPFWANVDRLTLEPKSLDRPLTPDQIIAGLSRKRLTQPLLSFEAVERHREQMIEPFLQTIERILNQPDRATIDEAALFSYCLAFLAKWREPRVYPLVVRWLSLPGEAAFDVGGDTVTEWGSRLLATLGTGDVEPIKQLILNRAANEFCRGQAIEALAILVAWGHRSHAEVADYFGWLAREGLERESNAVWDALLFACGDIEVLSVFDDLKRAGQEDLLAPGMVAEELEEATANPPGERLASFRELQTPFDDVVEETSWWQCFAASENDDFSPERFADEVFKPTEYVESEPYVAPQPYIAPPKIGRNEPCPCGSGKKYKKCCGH